MPKKRKASEKTGEVLVAVIRDRRDFAILREQKWYRVPVDSAPKRWPPQWLGFYQTKVFGAEAFAVHYYGRVKAIDVVGRKELFPDEGPSVKTDRQYYRVELDSLEKLEQAIRSARWRRIVFIPTTWEKFNVAAEINDLYDESPLEDVLWHELQAAQIAAERQWSFKQAGAWAMLDFAIFCQQGNLDIETDGDTWHSTRSQIGNDNERDNRLQEAGWHVLRFNGQQVREGTAEYCLPQITRTINRLGGLNDEGLVPRKFYDTAVGSAQQLSLFEEQEPYDVD